jgi:hypothetical protein
MATSAARGAFVDGNPVAIARLRPRQAARRDQMELVIATR